MSESADKEVVLSDSEKEAKTPSQPEPESTFTSPPKKKKKKRNKKTPPNPPPKPKKKHQGPPPPPPPPPPPKRKMASTGIGNLKPFDSSVDDFEDWEVTFNAYLVANDMDPTDTAHQKKCQAVFLSSIGIGSCALLKSLISPQDVESAALADLLKVMREHFKPPPKALAERFKFGKREQQHGETASQYLAALRSLARHCQFATTLDERLRDQFILGLKSEKVQRSVFREKDDVKLDDVLKIVLSMETAERSTAIVRGGTQQQQQEESSIHKASKFRSQRGNRQQQQKNANSQATQKQQQQQHNNKSKDQHYKKQSNNTQRNNKNKTDNFKDGKNNNNCSRCGSSAHYQSKCPHKETVKCFNCQNIGHFASMCFKRKNNPSVNNSVTAVKNNSNSVKVHSTRDIVQVRVNIDGKEHKMEFDTACDASTLGIDFWKNELNSPNLVPSEQLFKAYNGAIFEAVGELNTFIEYNGERISWGIPVCKGTSLFGKDLIRRFNVDWNEVAAQFKQINSTTVTTQKETVDLLMSEFKDIFQPPTAEDRIQGFKAKIILKDDATPRFLKARPLPYAVRAKVDKELEEMERTGVIEKVETSEWASPLVVVPKPNGKVRITGDFKSTVNNQLNITQYPIAVPEDIFASMNKMKIFSKLDGANAYHQLEIDDSCKKFLVINTHRGLYRYNVLPQGIASSPAIFQEFMDSMLRGISNATAYIDDCLLSGINSTAHYTTLREVFERMRKFNFKLSKKKCEIAQRSVEFLGHHISELGIATTNSKVKAINEMPVPKDLNELTSFLGLINFYCKFVPKLPDIAEPLYRMKKADVEWRWTKKCQTSFEEIKQKISTSPVLAHFDPSLPIGLSCDASSVGCGVVLFHKYPDGSERPIAFASKTLTETERRYSQIEKEGLSIIFGIKKYYKYLCARSFLLVTDHKPLLAIFGPKSKLPTYVASRLHHWSVFLQQFTYEVIYRKSADHGNADALSRLPMKMEHTTPKHFEAVISQVQEEMCDVLPVTSKNIKYSTARDVTLSRVLQYVSSGWPSQLNEEEKSSLQQFFIRKDEMTTINGVIMWGMRVIIPLKLRKSILEELHQCHTGIVKMKSLARMHVWWPGIDKDIKSCEKCQVKQADPPTSPLHPWQFPERPWQRLHLDLAGEFLNKMWLIIMDAHSKWPEVFCLHGTSTQSVTAKLEEVIARHGIPEQIVTDNGRQFISKEFENYCKSYNIKHICSSVYHARTNGEAERFVRTFKEGMKTSSSPIASRLQEFLFRYRTTPHSTTGVTPAELLFGRKLRTKLDLVHPKVKEEVSKAQTRQEASYNKKAKERAFLPDQMVWVKTFSKNEEKWSLGKIVDVLGPVTFQVEVGERKMKRHADQLRHAVTTSATSGMQPESALLLTKGDGLEAGEENENVLEA